MDPELEKELEFGATTDDQINIDADRFEHQLTDL